MNDRSDICKLIARTYTKDSIGQTTHTETSRDVFCGVSSITATEFFSAGREGIKAEYRLTLFAADYQSEAEVEYNGVRYVIYRTYQKSADEVEIYLERKAGVTAPTPAAETNE